MTRMAFALVLGGLAALVVAAPAALACDMIPPVKQLILNNLYTDAKQSVVDAEAAKKNAQVAAPVGAFVRAMEAGLDSPGARPGNPLSDCAFANFKAWAQDGALTATKPFNRGGEVRRNELLTGLGIFALKFREAGYKLDGEILTWLDTINRLNMDKYTRESNRGNLYIWAGDGAALHALLRRDPSAIAFEDQVWRTAMGAIRDNGVIPSEITRGKRALIYELYSFSATLVLRDARAALGQPESAQDHAKLKLLADHIGQWLCKPDELAALAGDPQEMPDAGYFSVVAGFGHGLLNDDWTRCGHLPNPAINGTFGGDTRRSGELLAKIAKAGGHPF